MSSRARSGANRAGARTPSRTPPRTVEDADVAAVLAWFDAEGRALPWRATRDDYAVWVSEAMAQQTSVVRAAQRWERWMARWPTVEALSEASLADVLAVWDGLGYPRRARSLLLAARRIVAEGWPEDLESLPGVGPYTAAAIRCFAREEPVLPRDVNVNRVLARRFPEGVDIAGDPWRGGSALMELGARVCTARRPACVTCPVADGCPASDGAALRAGEDPAPGARRQAPYEGSLRQRRGRLLRAVLAGGAVRVPSAGADREAAEGLVADGLLRRVGEELRPAE